MVIQIPVSSPLFRGNEKKYLRQCIDAGWVSSDGYFVQKFEEEFAKWSGNRYAVAVCNGTAALETAIWSLGIKDKRILVNDSTIISCALAILRTKNQLSVYRPYTDTTEILLRCHLFGDWDKSTSNNLIIDDASQYWIPFKVKDVACYSLYANKLITSGEGGILVTNRKDVYDKARSYRNLCHSEERFIHNDLGYNFRMSNLQAAVALAQLEQIDKFIAIKQKNRDLYKKYLPKEAHCLFDVEVPWMYCISTKFNAGEVVKKLGKKGIDCRRYFYPLTKQPCFPDVGVHYDMSDKMWNEIFYLPSGLTLTEGDIKWVCKCLTDTLRSMTKSM